MRFSLPHPADVVKDIKRDLGEEIDRYHLFAQVQRFLLAWFGSFFLLSARGPVDGWNALWSLLLASAAVAARQQWQLVPTTLVQSFLHQAWVALGGNSLTLERVMNAHPSANPTTGATQRTTMNDMNTQTPNPTPADPLGARTVSSPTLRVPLTPPAPSIPQDAGT